MEILRCEYTQFKYVMHPDLVLAQGNTYREQRQPDRALCCYARAFAMDPGSANAFNNYGNVLRETGLAQEAVFFLERALEIDPGHVTARFNRAVALLLAGDYERGWPAYESRWQFEHLRGQLSDLPNRWTGQDLRDQTVLILGEQGLGDNLQFSRFAQDLRDRGAKSVIMQVPQQMKQLLLTVPGMGLTVDPSEAIPGHDWWTPAMSLPGFLGTTLENLAWRPRYISPPSDRCEAWKSRLAPRDRLRVGVSWSGRRDTWINQHKSVPVHWIAELAAGHPEIHWVNLQIDADSQESQQLVQANIQGYPGTIQDLSDTAALIDQLDLVISVDTAISHLSAALGRPTWIMLNHYAVDWRWLLERGDSPWYPTARLFRQPGIDQWQPVMDHIDRALRDFKP